MRMCRYYGSLIESDPVVPTPGRQTDGEQTKGMVMHEKLGERA